MNFKNWFKSDKKSQLQTNNDATLKTKKKLWQNWLSSSKTLTENLTIIRRSLISIDVGVTVTDKIIAELKSISNNQDSINTIHNNLIAILKQKLNSIQTQATNDLPKSILIVGINGSGKTTTIGKLTNYFKQQNASVLLAAGDTFRAAAIEQLKIWGERTQTSVIAQAPGADSASVIFDAIKSAQAKNIDVLIADTAGRLHTQQNLMQELDKIKRVMQKADAKAPEEIWLVVDGTLGQNNLNQVIEFNNLLSLTGIIITKLDGSAKGGIVFAIADELQIPIKFIGKGEGIDGLEVFDSNKFVDDCFNLSDQPLS